jgi:hypothetical protein
MNKEKQIIFPIVPIGILLYILDFSTNDLVIQASAAIAAVAAVTVAAVGTGVSIYQANKNNQAAERFSAQQAAEQAKQQAILEKQKEEYKNLEFKNQYAGMENQFANMENVFEDLTVNQQQAEFERQTFQQSQANIMQGLQGAAGGSGIAALAQTMANQGALQAQRASASIGQQERQNQMAERREASRLQQQERAVDRSNDMLFRQGEADVADKEFTRQKTLLGMQFNEAGAASKGYQAAIANQQIVRQQGQEDIMKNVQGLGNVVGTVVGGGV